jgi:hypothetical protein
MKKLIYSLALTLLLSASAFAVTAIDYGQSTWTAAKVTLKLTGVPASATLDCCVYEADASCVLWASHEEVSGGGTVTVLIPKELLSFVANNKVQVSDGTTILYAKLVASGLLQATTAVYCDNCPGQVPSLTEYGLIGLAAILVLSGVWIFWRRRALA